MNFPEPSRLMTDAEGQSYFESMVQQIKNYGPDEIIAVARSGFSYGSWVAQRLNLPLGAIWPDMNLVKSPHTKKLVFVDDNILQGETFIKVSKHMKTFFPDCDFKWAVLFSDWHTPEHIRNTIIQGIRLPYYAMDPFWGSEKISTGYGIRNRDEN